MKNGVLLREDIMQFRIWLEQEEKSQKTLEKYMRDVMKFLCFTGGRQVSKELMIAYKQYLIDQNYAIRSVNSMLAAVNGLLEFLGLHECRVRQLKLQREVFCPEEKELTRSEYVRLLEAARKKPQIYMVLQTICATGIRVSELKYFTVESVQQRRVTVSCKNKMRIVFLPEKLSVKLLKYAAQQKIHKGNIFVNRNGKSLDRSYIWLQMKKLCAEADVKPSKVFPHNLRKLFAKCFYEKE